MRKSFVLSVFTATSIWAFAAAGQTTPGATAGAAETKRPAENDPRPAGLVDVAGKDPVTDEPPPAARPPKPQTEPSTEATAKPEPPKEPPKEPPASGGLQSVLSALRIRVYGTLRAVVDVTNGVETFGNPNSSAMTAAVNPIFLTQPDSAYLSFQVQQTRAGIAIGEKSPVQGQIEIDFIHFDQANPTVQAYPRIRIAEVAWTPAKGHKLFVGQNWDIFSPINNHTSNLVGNLFQAGNLGFMRHQLGYIGLFNGFELAFALGFQGSNAGPSFANLELDSVPTVALRLAYRTQKNGWFGVSAIGTGPRFVKGTESERRAAYGVNAFADLNLGPLNLRAEVYYAQNTANLGILNLAFGRFGIDMRDVGGYLSARANLGRHALYMLGGAAVILNPVDLSLGYTPATVAGASAVRSAGLGPGIEWNASIHLGYQYSPLKGLSLVLEPLLYVTRHKLADTDLENGTDPQRMAAGLEFGALYTF